MKILVIFLGMKCSAKNSSAYKTGVRYPLDQQSESINDDDDYMDSQRFRRNGQCKLH
mgnify:FL=1